MLSGIVMPRGLPYSVANLSNHKRKRIGSQPLPSILSLPKKWYLLGYNYPTVISKKIFSEIICLKYIITVYFLS
jgi:hypothetical protein